MKYVDTDTLDLCRDALLHGRPLNDIADSLNADVEVLAQLLGRKNRCSIATEPSGDEFDLWACDRLDDVL